MDFSQVGVAKTTSCDDFVHPEHGPAGITVHGITAAHEDYDALVQKHNPPKAQRVYIDENEERSIEVSSDPETERGRRRVLAAMVTGIDGFTGWKYTPEATQELFLRTDVDWLVSRWRRHLESVGKSTPKPASKPSPGRKSSGG